MAKYLILKNIEIMKANANPAWYIIGPPALTSYHGFIQSLLLKLLNENEDTLNDAKNLTLHEGFAIVHHDLQMLGSMKRNGWTYHPNQISSATAYGYDKNDYVKIKEKPTRITTKLSSQPTATCNLTIDLIIKLPEAIHTINPDKIKKILYGANIAGGSIEHRNIVISTASSYEEILKYIKTGFYIIDRHDLLLKKDSSESSLDLMLKTTRPFNKENSWIVPTSVGYLCLTDFELRDNSRNNNKVAYAEPIVTLTQYISVRYSKSIPFWSWTVNEINNKKVYILKGEVK